MICFHRQSALFLEDGSGGSGGMTCFLVTVTLTARANSSILQCRQFALFLKDRSGGAVGMNRFPGGKSLVFPVKVTLSGSMRRKFGPDSRMQIGSSRLQCLVSVSLLQLCESRRVTRDGHQPGMRLHPKMKKERFYEWNRDRWRFRSQMQGTDNGSGVGSSHQTGWTGLIAKLSGPRSSLEPAGTFCSSSSPTGTHEF